MKIGIATVQVPFIRGGAEILAESLRAELRARGFEAEIISMPFKWYPPERILDAMIAARLLDVTEVNGNPIDRLITLKFPAYHFEHPHKTAWLLHQHRQAYDLYGTEFGDLHQSQTGRAVAREILRWDNAMFPRHRALYTIADTVTERLRHHNGLQAQTLYHPPGGHERFRCDGYDPYILVPGRLDSLKRQHLIIEALAQTRGLGLVLIGQTDSVYGRALIARIAELGLQDRVNVRGMVSEEEKLDLYARCLAVYNGVYDEDYGYITLEAFLSAKPVIAHTDAGGPLEFITDRQDGYIVPPDPEALAPVLAEIAASPSLARALGETGRSGLVARGITWDHVIERLLD